MIFQRNTGQPMEDDDNQQGLDPMMQMDFPMSQTNFTESPIGQDINMLTRVM